MSLYPEIECQTVVICRSHDQRCVCVIGHMIRDVRVIGHLDAFLSVNQFGILVHILCVSL